MGCIGSKKIPNSDIENYEKINNILIYKFLIESIIKKFSNNLSNHNYDDKSKSLEKDTQKYIRDMNITKKKLINIVDDIESKLKSMNGKRTTEIDTDVIDNLRDIKLDLVEA